MVLPPKKMKHIEDKAVETAIPPKNQLPNRNIENKSFFTISGQWLTRVPHEKMDVVLENIRETAKSLEAFKMFRQNMLWECLKCGRKHKIRYRAQECHYFFVRITEVGCE